MTGAYKNHGFGSFNWASASGCSFVQSPKRRVPVEFGGELSVTTMHGCASFCNSRSRPRTPKHLQNRKEFRARRGKQVKLEVQSIEPENLQRARLKPNSKGELRREVSCRWQWKAGETVSGLQSPWKFLQLCGKFGQRVRAPRRARFRQSHWSKLRCVVFRSERKCHLSGDPYVVAFWL